MWPYDTMARVDYSLFLTMARRALNFYLNFLLHHFPNYFGLSYIKKFSFCFSGEYQFVNMSSGDCLYIPFKWIHQVRSYDRNIAVNLWWQHKETVNLGPEACKVCAMIQNSLILGHQK